MPKGLHPTAQAEWIRLAPLCLELGVLTEGDWLAWTMGFTSYSTWLLASEQMGGPEAWTFSTESGYEQVSALFPIVKQAYAATLQFLREFGLTPGARGGLNITPPERKPPGTALGDLLN